MASSHLQSLFISSIISPFLLCLLCADFFQHCHPVLCGEHAISNLSKKWFQQGDLLWLVRVLEQLSSRLFQSQHAWDGKMHGLEKGKRKMRKVRNCCIFHPKWLVVTLKTKGKQLNSSNLLDIKVIKLKIKVATEANRNVTVGLFSQMAEAMVHTPPTVTGETWRAARAVKIPKLSSSTLGSTRLQCCGQYAGVLCWKKS